MTNEYEKLTAEQDKEIRFTYLSRSDFKSNIKKVNEKVSDVEGNNEKAMVLMEEVSESIEKVKKNVKKKAEYKEVLQIANRL